MCLIICAHQYHSKFPLVIAANRDEFYSRPTETAHFQNQPDGSSVILAGKDLTQGGTWLGISHTGRFAAVTNIRNGNSPNKAAKSRGLLTSNFLREKLQPRDYLELLLPELDQYGGFNLLLGDRDELFYLNNRHGNIEKLSPGIYGLSNGELDSVWPKVERGKKLVNELLSSNTDVETDSLIDIMTDKSQAKDELLPDTGVPLELERMLSASFISNPDRNYGTRCTTAIVVNDHDQIRFCEQNYNEDTSIASRNFFDFRLSGVKASEKSKH